MLVSTVDGEPDETSADFLEFAPGEAGKARVTLRPKALGSWTQTLTVASNDPRHPKFGLTVTATIKPRFHLDSRLIDLGAIPSFLDTTLTVDLLPVEQEGFEILAVAVASHEPRGGAPGAFGDNSSRLALSHGRAGDAAENRWRIDVRLMPGSPAGLFNEKVQVHTSDPLAPLLELSVMATIEPGLVHPSLLEIDNPQFGIGQEGSLRITRKHGPPFRITGLTLNDPHLRADAVTLTAGEVYEIRVSVPPGTPKGHYTPWLLVRTDRPDQPLIRVKIKARVGRVGDGG